MNFYLLLPFLLRRLRTIRASAIVLIFSLFAYASSTLAITHFLPRHYPTDQQYLISSFAFLNFFAQLPVLAIGILTYCVFTNVSPLRRLVISANLLFLSLLVLLKLLTTFSIVRMLSHHIVMGAVFALFALTLACFPVKLFVNRAIALLGKISFSMYLTHFAVLELFKRIGLGTVCQNGDVPAVLHYLCVVAVTAPLSYLLYVTIERRGIAYGRRLIDRLEQGAALGRGWKGKLEGLVPVFGAPVSAALKRMS
jgi:peptidoglycan/LPS O-acetylase OafA/YrhL